LTGLVPIFSLDESLHVAAREWRSHNLGSRVRYPRRVSTLPPAKTDRAAA